MPFPEKQQGDLDAYKRVHEEYLFNNCSLEEKAEQVEGKARIKTWRGK